MKKLVRLAVAGLACAVLLAGCSGQGKATDPEEVVAEVFEAVKTVDAKTYQAYVIDDAGLFADSDSWGEGEKQLVDIMFHNMTYQIQSVETEDETAMVTADITNSDLSDIVMTAVGGMVNSAMSGDSLDEEAYAAQMMEAMREASYSEDVELSTNTAQIELVKTDGNWKLKMTNDLLNVMGGGNLEDVTRIME